MRRFFAKGSASRVQVLISGALAASWLGAHAALANPASEETEASTANQAINWRSEAQLGFLDSRGETKESQTLNGRLRIQAEKDVWRNDTRASFLYTETDKETTDERFIASHQVDYQWTQQIYSLLFGSYRFDGYDAFRHEYDLVSGLGYRVYRTERREWDLEAGLGAKYTERNAQPRDTDWSPLGRLASKFRQDLGETFELQQETTFGRSQESEDLRLVNSLAVKANEQLAVSLSYEWRRSKDLDVSDTRYDHITTLNLIYRWQP